MKKEDQLLVCKEPNCGREFIFTAGEQEFFEKQGFVPPKRCSDCRAKRKREKQVNVEKENERYQKWERQSVKRDSNYYVEKRGGDR